MLDWESESLFQAATTLLAERKQSEVKVAALGPGTNRPG